MLYCYFGAWLPVYLVQNSAELLCRAPASARYVQEGSGLPELGQSRYAAQRTCWTLTQTFKVKVKPIASAGVADLTQRTHIQWNIPPNTSLRITAVHNVSRLVLELSVLQPPSSWIIREATFLEVVVEPCSQKLVRSQNSKRHLYMCLSEDISFLDAGLFFGHFWLNKGVLNRIKLSCVLFLTYS